MKHGLSTATLDSLAITANSFASANGLLIEKERNKFEAAPMSLLPNAYPKAAFTQAQALAPMYNLLVDRVSRDADFLQQTLSQVVQQDPYTAKLLQLYQSVYNSDHKTPAQLADRFNIHRSDYMLHQKDDQVLLQQIELNTIAASFASLACKVASLHSFLEQRFAEEKDVQELLQRNQKAVLGGNEGTASGVPVNPALECLPAAMHLAVQRYQERFSTSSGLPLAVLFVVQEGETNTVDQRTLEFELFRKHGVPVVRLSLTKLQDHVTLDESSGALTIQKNDGSGQFEVALVYFRAGYAPTDYPDGDDGVEWKSRLLLEQSRATKAPSLGYHLAGTKKVQQELARPGVLERFFPNEPDMVDLMRQSFAGLYSLGVDVTDEDLKAVQAVLDGEHGQYVLKPQREGGGYNFYGEQLLEKLKANVKKDETGKLILDEKLGEYILMERLFPPTQHAILLRAGNVEASGDSVSELGCYGTILCDADGKVLHNEYGGFLLRTKLKNVNEGGVAAGFATLSSPYLC